MAHSILINIPKMKIVAASTQPDSVKCLAILAEILHPLDDYLIIGPTEEWLKKCFSFDELILIYNNTTGSEIKRAYRDTVIYQCVNLLENSRIDPRTSVELLATLGRPFVVSKLPIPEKEVKSESTAKKGYTRPKEGTLTGKVWEICDKNFSSTGKIPDKSIIVKQCVLQGIAPATAGTQFTKWKSTI